MCLRHRCPFRLMEIFRWRAILPRVFHFIHHHLMLMERASGRHRFRTANATSIAILQQNVHPDGKLQHQIRNLLYLNHLRLNCQTFSITRNVEMTKWKRKEKEKKRKKRRWGKIEHCIAKSYVPVMFFFCFFILFSFFFCRIYRKPEKSSRREKILITIEEAPVKTRPKSPTGEQCALSAAKMAILYFVYYAAFETPSHLYRIDNNYKIFDRRRWKQSAFDYTRRRKFSTLSFPFFFVADFRH